MPDSRVPVPDPGLVRRAARRVVPLLAVVVVLTTFFTAGGISLVAAGELPGLPFAAGGAALQVALVVLAATALRVRRTLRADTVSRAALASARRTTVAVQRAVLATIAALLVYALARAVVGDRWTLLTAGLIAVPLGAVAVGARRLRAGYDRRLS